jgi:hypothetical protein
VLGTIRSSFFLLPLPHSEHLAIPVHEERGHPRSWRAIQRSIEIGSWKDDEWPPEHIIQYYGPATWAEDGSWGYQTPIWMFNHIRWLQAMVEIITNETAKALIYQLSKAPNYAMQFIKTTGFYTIS